VIPIDVVAALLALVIGIYLLIALLRPELF
jgi:hypothetical protein